MPQSNLIQKTAEQLQQELDELQHQLDEANDTIEAIRTGQIDALVVQGENGHQLYTLKSADQTYRVFIEKMTEGAVTLNPQGLILYCNSQFASMVNQPLSKVIGILFEDFIAPEHKNDYEILFAKCWKNDCKGEVFLLSGENKTPVQLSLTTLELEEGESLSIILTDLTAQKATQQQLKLNNEQLEATNIALELSNHDLQQFASVASHDLQEPLRKIQVFSNILREKGELSSTSINYLEKIIESSGRMKNLIVDILNYSKLSSNGATVECTDLNEVLNEIIDDFDLLIKEKQAEILIENLACIDVNKKQIRQVFQNIISNALKFSTLGKAPVIKVTCTRIKDKSFTSELDSNGPYCLISIADNGIGFDETYVNNIFALFERLNSKDMYEGTGIGMAIAKRIVDKHDGLITATSANGLGSVFKIILPINQPA